MQSYGITKIDPQKKIESTLQAQKNEEKQEQQNQELKLESVHEEKLKQEEQLKEEKLQDKATVLQQIKEHIRLDTALVLSWLPKKKLSENIKTKQPMIPSISVVIHYEHDLYTTMYHASKKSGRPELNYDADAVVHQKKATLSDDKFHFVTKRKSTKPIAGDLKKAKVIFAICVGSQEELDAESLKTRIKLYAEKGVEEICIFLAPYGGGGETLTNAQRIETGKSLHLNWRKENETELLAAFPKAKITSYYKWCEKKEYTDALEAFDKLKGELVQPLAEDAEEFLGRLIRNGLKLKPDPIEQNPIKKEETVADKSVSEEKLSPPIKMGVPHDEKREKPLSVLVRENEKPVLINLDLFQNYLKSLLAEVVHVAASAHTDDHKSNLAEFSLPLVEKYDKTGSSFFREIAQAAKETTDPMRKKNLSGFSSVLIQKLSVFAVSPRHQSPGSEAPKAPPAFHEQQATSALTLAAKVKG